MKNGKKNKKTQSFGENLDLIQSAVVIFTKLKSLNAKYVLVGGVACNLHGLPRSTQDIDLLIPRDTKNTEKILEALSDLPWQQARELDAEEVIKKPFTIIGDQPRVDLLTIAGTERFEAAFAKALTRKILKTEIVFADLDTLIESKKTDRTTDKADVEKLKRLKKNS